MRVRTFAGVGVLAAVVLLTTAAVAPPAAGAAGAPTNFDEFTVAQLESMFQSGRLSSVDLTNFYLKRIAAQ